MIIYGFIFSDYITNSKKRGVCRFFLLFVRISCLLPTCFSFIFVKNTKMKIVIKEGAYEFSYDSNNEHPDVEDAVFSVCYLLSRIYTPDQVKEGMLRVLEDI